MQQNNLFDDFEFYREQGEVGANFASIQISNTQPEIGSILSITCELHGIENAELLIDNNIHLVEHDQIVEFLVERENNIHLIIRPNNEVLDELVVTPLVLIPRLISWGVNDEATYSTGEISGRIVTTNATELHLAYKFSNEPIVWHITELVDGNFTIPLEQEAGNLTIRLTMRSRHADFIERATQTTQCVIAIRHPKPILLTADHHQTNRFDPFLLNVNCKWVTGILFGDRFFPASPNKDLNFDIPIETTEVGTQEIQLVMTDLNHEPIELAVTIQVTPRQPAIKTTTLNNHNIIYQIKGLENPSLSIRGKTWEIPITGKIKHCLLFKTDASISGIDDLNNITTINFLLGSNESTHQWSSLPPMSPMKNS